MDNMMEKTDRSIRLLKMFDMLQRGKIGRAHV